MRGYVTYRGEVVEAFSVEWEPENSFKVFALELIEWLPPFCYAEGEALNPDYKWSSGWWVRSHEGSDDWKYPLGGWWILKRKDEKGRTYVEVLSVQDAEAGQLKPLMLV